MSQPTFADIKIFEGIDPDTVNHLTRHSVSHTFQPGDFLIQQDDTDTTVYAIVEGQVRVTRTHTNGTATEIAVRHPREIVGEMAAIDKAPRSANVVALGDVTAYAIPGRVFEEVVQSSHKVAWKLMGELSNRLRLAAKL